MPFPPERPVRRASRRQDTQSRHHRAHRSWQDDADRQHLPRRSRVPRERPGRGAGDGQQRPGARAGHHHSRQALYRRVGRPSHQHHRHPRPRRFQRRGGARAQHGRLRPAPGGCQRGAHAPDALRAHAGPAPGAAAHRHRQQGGPTQRRPLRRVGCHVRPVRGAGRERPPAGLPDPLRIGTGGLDRRRPRRVQEGRARARRTSVGRRRPLARPARRAGGGRHGRPVRDDHRAGSGATCGPGCAVPHAGEHPGVERLHRTHRLWSRTAGQAPGRRRGRPRHDSPGDRRRSGAVRGAGNDGRPRRPPVGHARPGEPRGRRGRRRRHRLARGPGRDRPRRHARLARARRGCRRSRSRSRRSACCSW